MEVGESTVVRVENGAFLAALAACASLGRAGFVKYPNDLFYFPEYKTTLGEKTAEVLLSGWMYEVLVVTAKPDGINVPNVLSVKVVDKTLSKTEAWSRQETSFTLELRWVREPVPHWVAGE
jgi:hypothetical protein